MIASSLLRMPLNPIPSGRCPASKSISRISFQRCDSFIFLFPSRSPFIQFPSSCYVFFCFPLCQLTDSLAFFDLARRLAGSLSFSTDKKWRTNNKEGIMTLRHIYGFIFCPVLFSRSATTPARPSSRVSVSTLIRGECCYKHNRNLFDGSLAHAARKRSRTGGI